ncbi:MAG: phosphoglycolate phosphatase [Rhodomicrobium sp.]
MEREAPDWPQAVVFDLDGTLIDSAHDLADALNYALDVRHLAPFPVAQVKEMVGGGIPKLVERALRAHGVADVELLPLAADFVNYYGKNLVRRTTLFEGAAELLEMLKGEGRRLGLCSNKQHAFTVEIVEELGIAKYFSAVAGEREGHRRKPDPAPLLEVLHALQISPQDAVMVGDSSADVECAKAAGVVPVVVSFGYSRVAPQELGASALIERLLDLPKCLAQLRPVGQ